MDKFILYILVLLPFSSGCALFQTPVCNCKKQSPVACLDGTSAPITLNNNSGKQPLEDENSVSIPSSEAANLQAVVPWNASLVVDPNEKNLQSIFQKYGKPIAGFQGEFGTKYGDEYVAILPKKIIFANGKWISTFDIGAAARKVELDLLNEKSKTISEDGVPLKTAYATDLIRDGVNEVAVIVASNKNPAKRVYRFQIYKTIGQHIAKVFDQPIAIKTATTTRIVARVDFVDGAHSTRIRVTPLSEDGLLDVAHIRVYTWNRWEGMFRIPQKAPTSPQR